MKRLSLRLAIALATFFVGVSFVAVWLFNRSNAVVDVAPKPHDCHPSDTEDFDASDYKGVLTRRFYAINENKTTKPVLDEQANAKATADVFRRFRETPLASPAACVNESYRLTWIPTFHAPTVIRIWRSGDKHFVVVKRLNGRGGYGMGDLDAEQTRSLTLEEWQSFADLVHQAQFLKLHSIIKEPIPNDGATWTFEGMRNGEYHFVNRITPPNELNQLFRKMFDLTDIEIEHEHYL